MNSQTLVLITRVNEQCDDGRKEWCNIWGFNNDNSIVTVDSNSNKREFNTQPVNGDINNAFLMILKGHANRRYDIYSRIIQQIQNNIIIAIHPGMGASVESIKKSLSTQMNGISHIINNAVGYTLGCDNDTHQVVIFANKLKNSTVTVQDLTNLKDFFLKKKPTPHLIALSILSQGYLLAHGAIRLMNNMITIDGEKKKLTDGQNWWKPAFEDVFRNEVLIRNANFENTSIYSEVSSRGKQCKDTDAIKGLFDAIKKINGNTLDANAVTKAYYDCIKQLL